MTYHAKYELTPDPHRRIHGVDFVGHIILFYMLHRELFFYIYYVR